MARTQNLNQPKLPMSYMPSKLFFYKADQIAFPVGETKDSYYISSCVHVDTCSNVATVYPFTVIKNYFSNDPAKRLELGTFKAYDEAYNFIRKTVKDILIS